MLGKFDIEFLIACLFLIPAEPNAAVAIEARPAPACIAKSSPTLLAAPFTLLEIASGIFDSGFESDDGVSSDFLSIVVVPGELLYILTLLLLLIGCISFEYCCVCWLPSFSILPINLLTKSPTILSVLDSCCAAGAY